MWVLPLSAIAQRTNSLQLCAGISFQNLFSSLGTRPHASYELALLFSPIERFTFGIKAAMARPSVEYDLIDRTATEKLRLASYGFSLGYALIDGDAINVELATRFGLMTLSSEPRSVSMGGLGSIVVPGRSDRRFVLNTGTSISHHLFSRLALFMSPELVLISPLQLNKAGFSVEGGIAVEIF